MQGSKSDFIETQYLFIETQYLFIKKQEIFIILINDR